jgi:50S ribosomal protein uL30
MEKKQDIKKVNSKEEKILVVIRIQGRVETDYNITETLKRLRMKKKYSCVLINPKDKSLMGMLNKIKYYVAYGEIGEESLSKLLAARAKKLDKKEFDAGKVSTEILSGKTLEQLKFIPFMRLHPPRKGIKTKLQYPKGVLGYHGKDINKLVERML